MKIIKKIMGIFGYKLTEKNLVKNEQLIPENAKISPGGFVEELIKIKKNFFLIQIGANDGKVDDFLSTIIKKENIKSILVEPIKENFSKLKNVYNNYQNVILENSAIDIMDKEKEIYKVDQKYLKYYGNHIPYISSFLLSHLIKHGVKKKHIVKDKVKCLSPKSLMEKFNIKNFDLLVIDTEGYDDVILNEFLKIDNINPVIIFEWIHIKNSNFIKLYKKLEEKNYKLLRIEKDLICFKKNLDVKFSININ